MCRSVGPSVRPSIRPSIYPSVRLFVCSSVVACARVQANRVFIHARQVKTERLNLRRRRHHRRHRRRRCCYRDSIRNAPGATYPRGRSCARARTHTHAHIHTRHRIPPRAQTEVCWLWERERTQVRNSQRHFEKFGLAKNFLLFPRISARPPSPSPRW